MALVFSQTQAIKFLETGENSFNSEAICSCGTESNEQWSYVVTAGDTIDFQILSNCELSDDFIENGSFEAGTGDDFTDSDWTRSLASAENTNLTRIASNTAQCGESLAYWENEATTPNTASITQTYAGGFVQGSVYKFTIKAKITEGVLTNSNAGILKLTIGGQVYLITPTTEWADYEITVVFNTAPANNNIKIEINTASPANVTEMFVDCVTMQEYQGCCIRGLVNNGDFELGQRTDGEIVATSDNWTLTTSTILDTGGRNSTRCASLNGIGGAITQNDVLLDNTTHVIKFWAKASAVPTSVSVYAGTNLIGATALTLDWVEYSFTYDNISDEDIQFIQDETDETVFIDDIVIASIPLLTIYINDLENDTQILVDPSDVEAYTDHINVSIPVDSYAIPSCFNICVEPCLDNLLLNPGFEEGSGNTFTSWTKEIPSATNRLLYSEQITQFPTWNFSGVTLTANNTTAPNGTITADLVTEDAGFSQEYYVYQNISLGGLVTATFSFYIKPNGRDIVYLQFYDTAAVATNTWFDIATGQVLTNQNDSATIDDAGNGWFRCSITRTAVNMAGGGSNVLGGLADADGSVTYTGDGTSGAWFWGGQLETGDVMTSYKATTNSSVTADEGSIVEAQRTNLLLRSQEFDNASWVKANTTISANDTTAPDGTLTADKILTTLTNQSNVNQNYPININTYITLSVYVKYIDSPFFILTFYDGGIIAVRRWFNIQTGVIGTLTNSGFISVENTIETLENGWFRITMSAIMPTSTGNLINYLELASSDGVISSNAGQSAYIWGAQLEQSPYATAYIPTTTTALTVADGRNGTRAPRFNRESLPIALYQTVTTVGVEYRLQFWAKYYEGFPELSITDGTTSYGSFAITSEDYELHELTFTATGTALYIEVTSGDYSGVAVDDVQLVTTPVETRCSESFKYTEQPDPCMKELVWYDNNDEAMDVVYSSGFRNKMRVKAQLQSPQYIKEDFVSSFSNDQISINSFTMRKTNDLAIDNVPEFVVDRLALMAGVSNIEYDTTELRPANETEVTANYDKNSRTMSMTITVSPSAEYLGKRQYNCS